MHSRTPGQTSKWNCASSSDVLPSLEPWRMLEPAFAAAAPLFQVPSLQSTLLCSRMTEHNRLWIHQIVLTPPHISGPEPHISATKTKKTCPWVWGARGRLGHIAGPLECSVTRTRAEAGQGGSTEGGFPVEVSSSVMSGKTLTSEASISLCTKWE